MSDFRQGRVRARVIVALCVVMVAAALSTGRASADPTGVIAGRVTQGGSPAAGVCVESFSTAGNGYAITDADGRYQLTGLASGTYRVRFQDCGYRLGFHTEYYDHTGRDNALPVVVTDGATTAGIDTDLPAAGSIAGRVTGAGGVPLDRICVRANDFGYFRPGRVATTDADGRFVVTALPQDAYYVLFYDCEGVHGVVGEFYENQPSDVTARFVEVAQGTHRTGIDAELDEYASISGHVTGPGPDGGSCLVEARDRDGRRLASGFTETDGDYVVERVPPGEVRVQFQCSFPTPVRDEWYADRQALGSATPLAVAPGAALTGIDAVVGAPAAITGRVTGVDGQPLADVCAAVHQGGVGPLATATTDADGRYQVAELTAGAFEVRFTDCSPSGSRALGPVWFGGDGDPATADPVTTTAGQTRGGVDAVLSIDSTPPETVITAGPAEGSVVNDFPVAMSFATSAPERGVNFECRLDGGAWSSCTSAYDYFAMVGGVNVFEVRATDEVGNTDPTPARRTFVYDAGPPDTRITAGPANGSTVHGDVTYSFDGRPAIDTARLECRVDAGTWATCTSPRTLTGLADGDHTWAVRAVDAYQQADPTPATRTFVLDAAACTAARQALASAQAGLTAAKRRQATAQQTFNRAASEVRRLRAALRTAPKARKPALQRKLKAATKRRQSAATVLDRARSDVSRARSAVVAADGRVDESC